MNTIHLTTLTDSNFLVPTIVMLTSVKENMRKDAMCCFHVFHSDLISWEIKKIKELETPSFIVDVNQLKNNQFSNLPNCGRHGQATLMRLNLPDLLPELDRVLYLDGDVMVLQDLQELYNTPLGDCLIAGVRDYVGLYNIPHFEKFPGSVYINAGVMVMDLDRMRKEHIIAKFQEDAKIVTQFWKHPDQDLINYTCSHRIKPLPPKYNGVTMSLRNQLCTDISIFNEYHQTAYSSFEEFENDLVLIHWAGNPRKRPWEICGAACSEAWMYYLLKSPLKHANLHLYTPWEAIRDISGLDPHYRTVQYGLCSFLPIITTRSSYNPQNNCVKKRIKLFGFFPLLSAKGTPKKLRWNLFNCLPIWQSQEKE